MYDYLRGADNEDEAKQLIKNVIYVHSKWGFTTCNWIANSKYRKYRYNQVVNGVVNRQFYN